jgi:hypothetical protein
MATIIMKNLKITLVLLLSATIACAQLSPRKQANGKIGEVTVDVDYSAPSVRERQIYGALVPYNTVWRAGANANTTIAFDKDVTIGDNSVPAGKYGLYIIPKKDDKWIVILSTRNDARGTGEYTEKQDQMRIEIKPEMVEKSQEQLQYKVVEKGVKFAWEKASFVLPVK